MIQPYLIILPTENKGRGVFTTVDILANTVIEIAPVIVMEREDRLHLDLTKLHDYIFEWGESQVQCCVGLGYLSIYNHSNQANCEYEMDYVHELMTIKTVWEVKKGEELLINYNGSCNDPRPVWFEVQ